MQIDHNFKNNLIDFSTLPNFQSVTKTSIEKSFAYVVHFNYLIIEFTLILAFIIFKLFVDNANNSMINYLFFAVFLFFLAIHIYNIFQLKSRKFAFRDHDVIYSSGILSQTETIIPYNKLQHLAVQQGWLSRMFNLARIEFYTAGGDTSDLKISGMKAQDAFRFREHIVKLISDKSKKLQDIIKLNESLTEEINQKDNQTTFIDGH